LARSGLETIRARHTCAHRVDELEAIYRQMQPAAYDDLAEPAAVGEVQA